MSVVDYMKTFLEHKEKLDEVDRQDAFPTSEDSYDGEFAKIRELSLGYKTDNVYPSTEAMKSCNVSKNRFKDIVPFDYTRVKLKAAREGSTSDYINASYIRGAIGDQMYIAAQGPTPKTVNDFWQMLWENDVRVILMACREYEGNPPKLKCQRYWPSSTTEELLFGDIRVTMPEKEEKTDFKEHLIRHMVASVGEVSRKIIQFHYMDWPDTSVPRGIPGILDLMERLRKVQPLDAKETPPVLFHCSAGCGRTGTMLAIDFVMSLLKYGKLTEDFKLYDVIVQLRRQRMAIVQSLEQYVFVHEAIAVLFKRQLELVASSVYENINARTPKPKEEKSKPPISSRKPSQKSDADGKTPATSPIKLPEIVNQGPVSAKQLPAPPISRTPYERSCDQKGNPAKLEVETIPVVYEVIGQENSPDKKKISPVSKPSRPIIHADDDTYEEVMTEHPDFTDRRPTKGDLRQIKSKEASLMTTDYMLITYKGININYPNRFSKKPRGQRPFRSASGTAKAFCHLSSAHSEL